MLISFAIRDFNAHIKMISGVELPVKVVGDVAKIVPPAIVIGSLAKKTGREDNS